jgi:transaldolase
VARFKNAGCPCAHREPAYQIYFEEMFGSDRFGNGRQRSWCQSAALGRTGTKNPGYKLGEMRRSACRTGYGLTRGPVGTLEAYRAHGKPKDQIEQEVVKARWALDLSPDLGISIDKVTQQHGHEGVEKSNECFDKLIETLNKVA